MVAFNKETSAVYLLDDDTSVLKATSRLLDSVGWKVEAFTDPIEFLERAATYCPELVVIDILMPEMNGLEVQTRLHLQPVHFRHQDVDDYEFGTICCGTLQEFNWIGKSFDLPTNRIEEAARGFQDRRIIIQQVHSRRFFVKRNHIYPRNLSVWSTDFREQQCSFHISSLLIYF